MRESRTEVNILPPTTIKKMIEEHEFYKNGYGHFAKCSVIATNIKILKKEGFVSATLTYREDDIKKVVNSCKYPINMFIKRN